MPTQPTLLADAKAEDWIKGLGNFLPGGGASNGQFEPTLAPQALNNLFTTIFGLMTIVAGLAFLIYFMIGALNWITGGDDKGKVDTAKKYMTNGAIGLIIIVAAYSITWVVGQVLGFDILNPGNLIETLTGQTPPTP